MTDLPGEAQLSDSQPDPQGPSRRRPLAFILGVVVLIIIVLGAWFAYQAIRARSDLKHAATHARQLKASLESGDAAGAQVALKALQQSSKSAKSSTDGFLWPLAAHLPALGDDVDAVRTISSVLDDIARRAMPPIVNVADSFDVKNFSPKNGRIDLAPLKRIASVAGPAHSVVAEGNLRLNRIDSSGLTSQLRGPVDDLREKLGNAEQLLGTADTALKVLPPMLGEHQKCNYLVIFQNNAEIRATGGLPGAFAIVSAQDGKISLGRQGAGSGIHEFNSPVLPLTAAEKQIYSDLLGTYFVDSNLTPDFPRTAQIAREMWRRESRQTVDGVLSVDPITLSYILKGTGPVALADGSQLTAGNAVDRLLNGTYLKYPDKPAAQDAFFASAAKKVFDAVSSGQGDPRVMIQGLAKAASEHRVLLWTSHAEQQNVLAPTTVAGALPTKPSESPQVGVYLNDATGAKMDYYLTYDTSVKSNSCSPEGVQSLPMTMTLKSNAPANAASLPSYVSGGGVYGVPRGSILAKLDVYAPFGGSVKNVRFNGKKVDVINLKQDGRTVMDTRVQLKAGQKIRITMDVASGPNQRGTTHVDVTPGAQPGSKSYHVPSSCG